MAVILHASTTRHNEWDGPKRYVRIIIHDTIDEFRNAAEAHAGGDFGLAAGCFHPALIRERYDKEMREWVVADTHFAGIIRLADEHIDEQVIVHECVHAAAHIFRMDIEGTINLGDVCLEKEEKFAYIVGDLSQQVLSVMRRWERK